MSSKKKAPAKKSSVSKAELKSSLSTTRTQLTKTEAKLAKARDKTERWKKEATAQRKAAARAGARVEKLQQKLDRAADTVAPTQSSEPVEAVAAGRPVTQSTAPDGVIVPDESWTVVQLRAEARARGLVGVSNTPKARLLAALS